ncbi:MAG: efflux RND transporter periplasmic adaptor subunit [Alphaproteobacteria bacterium]|nr:efflux RND transporter periplasmic adaptor subunit [Alphaproteobacteria bacterium]NNF25023.1 efflux RND transporter periplasmic adaptor subunit [Paracoccaceae bacterium]
MRRFFRYFLLGAAVWAGPAAAGTLTVEAVPIVEWKAVFGQVEARDRVPARARIGGTVVALEVTEGDRVAEGQRIAMVQDDKLSFQLDALNAQIEALEAQRDTALADLERGRQLIERGVITRQRLDQLETTYDVLAGQLRSLGSERQVVQQRMAEGEIVSPGAGVVLSVPVSRGSVIAPTEPAAVIGGGGFFLRLAVPERHAGDLEEGDRIELGTDPGGAPRTGRLVKLYPLIEGGRVQADVEVDGLTGRFVGQRLPVRLPVAERMAILVPQAALVREGGLDFVTVQGAGGESVARAVVPGGLVQQEDGAWREILSGLRAGEAIVVSDD